MKKRHVFAAIGLLAAGALAYYIYEEPAAGMYLCPSCYGFEKATDRVYVDSGMPVAEREKLAGDMAEAVERVRTFWGRFERQPLVFICGSDACDARMKYRGAKAKAFGGTFILVYMRGRNAMFLAHEFSHIELFSRIGSWRAARGAVPAWFNEGLAVIVARDSRSYETDASGELACRTEPDGPLPSGVFEWSRAMADRERPLYAMAACAVIRWMNENGGRQGVLDAVDRAAQGEPVDFAYSSSSASQ